MKLSKKSWHYRLHCLMYGETVPNPKNFCLYFWKSIVWGIIWTIIMLPFLPIPLFVEYIIHKYNIDKDEVFFHKSTVKSEGLWSFYVIMCLVINFFVFTVICMTLIWFVPKSNDFIISVGTTGYSLTFMGLMAYFYSKIIQGRRDKKRHSNTVHTEPKNNIFIEGVKAWYKRNCPIIKWKD